MEQRLKEEIISLIERTKSIIITAVKADGSFACDVPEGDGKDCAATSAYVPIVKAVSKLGNDDLRSLYFETSPGSEFIIAYKTNPLACAYMFDDDKDVPYPSHDEKYYGLTLFGTVSEVFDLKLKERFMDAYHIEFYPKGAEDNNFHLFCFYAQRGKYFGGISGEMENVEFDIKE